MALNTQVVIVGAGPVGLALALGLARHGVHTVVLEQREKPSQYSRAPAILTRTLEILDGWGVFERFRAEGTYLEELRAFWVGSEEPVLSVPLGQLRSQTRTPGVLVLPQNRTEALLAAAAEESGLCEIRRGHRVVAFRETSVGVRVDVQPNEGAAYTERCAFLAGCDGAHSAVRAGLGFTFDGKTYPRCFLLADFAIRDNRDKQPWPRLRVEKGRLSMAIRIAPQLWRMIGLVGQDTPDAEALAPAALAHRAERLLGSGAWDCVWAQTFNVHCRTATAFGRGRVALAGDAAHINSPAGGQGMNSGIQDANNLAWKLARALDKEGDYKLLLRSYNSERRDVVQRDVARYTDGLTRLLMLPRALTKPTLRHLMGRGLQFLLHTPAFICWLLPRASMLRTHYRSSPLLLGAHPLVGARAPNATLHTDTGQVVRLLDTLRGRALVVLFESRAQGSPVLAVQRGIEGLSGIGLLRVASDSGPSEPSVLRDAQGDAWRQWHAGDGMLALIRPDGHVGWVSSLTAISAAEVRIHVRHALGMRPARVVHVQSPRRSRTTLETSLSAP